MAVAQVTKGPHLRGEGATLVSRMDDRDNPSRHDLTAAHDRLTAESLDSIADVVDEERLKKVARLKQAVADGTYHVSAEDLADKLIAHMLAPRG